MPMKLKLSACVGLLLVAVACGAQSPTAPTIVPPTPAPIVTAPLPPPVWTGQRLLTRPASVTAPRPTLFLFAREADLTLDHPSYNQIGTALQAQGWLIVSLDIPGHGENVQPGETGGLTGWAERTAAGEDWVQPFTQTVSQAIDYLIRSEQSLPDRIYAAGLSRGGFLALHAAAADARIKAVVACWPVTDLRALEEFAALHDNPLAAQLRIHTQAAKLSHQPIYILMADHDPRVSTEQAVTFAQSVRDAGGRADVDLFPGNDHLAAPDWGARTARWVLQW